MANSTTNIQVIDELQEGVVDAINENFDAASTAMAFGRNGPACVGLTFAIYGGVAPVSGVPTFIANQSWLLTGSATNYIRLNRAGTFTVATTAPAGWPGPLANGAIALYDVTCGVSTVTSYNDWRSASGLIPPQGGAAISWRYTFSTTTADADPGDGKLRLDNATQNTATTIRADLLDEFGVDRTAILATLDDSTSTVKGQVKLSHAYDSSKWLMFDLVSIASPAGYRNITVTNSASSTANPFANNDLILFEFTRTGDKGAAGATGSAGFSYNYSTTTTASDPGSGTLRFNNATLSSATALYISETDALANNLAAEIATWDDPTSTVKCKLHIFKETDPTKFSIFNITGTITDNGSWDTFTVDHVVSGSALANADACKVVISRTGDKGDTGATGASGTSDYILLEDQKAAGTQGGTTTTGSFLTRTLNTEVSDDGGHCTLASNQFTLAAGTYIIRANAPAYNCGRTKARLRNVTDGSTILVSTQGYNAGSADQASTFCAIVGKFTIGASKALEIQQRVGNAQANAGFGIETNYGEIEIYTQVELWKVA